MKRGRRGRKTREMQQVAFERIGILFTFMIAEALAGRLDYLDRYVKNAKRIGQKMNVRIPTDMKRLYCPKCYWPYFVHQSTRFRLRNGKKIITCGRCGTIRRLAYKHPSPRASGKVNI